MTKLKKVDGLGFGERADMYNLGRKGYTPVIFDFIEMETGGLGESAVDVGCGTGISTRQLSARWSVTGVDADPRMLRWARYAQKDHPPPVHTIAYKLALATHLPFKNETQRLVTNFGAFHYFATPNTVTEFKRVLVPVGVIGIVHQTPREEDLFEVAWRSVVAGYIGSVPRRHKDEINYNPRLVVQLLRDGGFVKVKGRHIQHAERYTLAEAVARVQSMTHWKAVPDTHKTDAEQRLRLAFQGLQRKKTNAIERLTDVWCILGTKPMK